MEIDGIRLTHKGWFGICPVYIGGLESGVPALFERSTLFVPLFDVSEFLFGICVAVLQWFKPEYEPAFPIYITGELNDEKV